MGNQETRCAYCYTSVDDCINSRRCFMTGEYCSKQTNIQKERERLHEQTSINAFVVMNFSDMSDVVYKWRMKSFIEELKKYLFINMDTGQIACSSIVGKKPDENEQWQQIRKINVIRADSNPASNFVICNRVCQQMQIADLVITDVSVENTNVFYEFGMAVALEKMILPICYSESFYKRNVPLKTKEEIGKLREKKNGVHQDNHKDEEWSEREDQLEKHIDCYPWRRRLFEFYGIRYRREGSSTAYLDFDLAVEESYGFSDTQYNRFPYDGEIDVEVIDENGKTKKITQKSGVSVYNRLRKTYNNAKGSAFNTLVVYTMDGFLNESEAGCCIVNYFNNMTRQMKEEHCFCGDRVGILIQSNSIVDDDKDAETEKDLEYSVGEIIHIGMNQATFTAQKDKIKTSDFLDISLGEYTSDRNLDEKWKKQIIVSVKDHIRNKSLTIIPNNPIYVKHAQEGLQKGILDRRQAKFDFEHYFCLYHVMLRTLKYTNEIVVDISKNSLQSLFWLGAAHGSDIYAITVQHEETEQERIKTTGSPIKRERSIFDVAGLWTAILRSHDTEGFYRQLELAQMGIEQHTKLMLRNVSDYEVEIQETLRETALEIIKCKDSNEDKIKPLAQILDKKTQQEASELESYYRDRFWKCMLRYNRLRIYLPHRHSKSNGEGPRVNIVKWDMDAMSAVSYYLSKRKLIGEYHVTTLEAKHADMEATECNFICIGNDARPLQRPLKETSLDSYTLAQFINTQLCVPPDVVKEGQLLTREMRDTESLACEGHTGENRRYRGFISPDGIQAESILTQFPDEKCSACMRKKEQSESASGICKKIYIGTEYVNEKQCELIHNNNLTHSQLAQLLMWREIPCNQEGIGNAGKIYFRVALTGVSGPATLALASILVDQDQKKRILKQESNATNEWLLLKSLQEKVRKSFLDRYFDVLDRKFKIGNYINVSENYVNRVKYATGSYLSTVLYRYFLPFLSKEDEYRIHNGMETFITAMRVSDTSPFSKKDLESSIESTAGGKATLDDIAIMISGALRTVMDRFRGVEVLYRVEVAIDKMEPEQEWDDRMVLNIAEIPEGKCTAVNCLFMPSGED